MSVIIVLYECMFILNDWDTIYEWMDMIDFGKDIETTRNMNGSNLHRIYVVLKCLDITLKSSLRVIQD